MLYKKASDSTKIGHVSPSTPYIRSVRLFKNRTVCWGVDYIRSTQNGNDSLMVISRAIAKNVTGPGVTIVYVVVNHSLITSLPRP
jgi:hypothetical protein